MSIESGMNRREFLRGTAKAAVGLGAFMVAESVSGQAEAKEVPRGIEYEGFENYTHDLEAVQTGLAFALAQVSKKLSADGAKIDCSKMPLRIELRKDGKAGTQVFVSVMYQGQKLQIDPVFHYPGQTGGASKTVDAIEFAKYVQDNLLESKDIVKNICR